MELVAQLEELLNKAQNSNHPELGIKDWRIVIHETKGISLGIKNNTPGTVYTPPSYRMTESGDIFLVWADGRCSQAKVQAGSGQEEFWQGKLKEWRQASYEDPDGSFIPEPESMPLVAVEDRNIYRILQGEDEQVFTQVARILKDKPAQAQVQGSIQAAWGYRHIRNSKGLAVTYQESYYTLYYSFDNLVSAGFAKRRMIKPEEWNLLWQTTTEYHQLLDKEAQSVRPGTTVVLSASVVEQMMGKFILPNFSGQAVLEGQSAYTKEQFTDGESVFDEKLSIEINPLKPLELGSYLVTSEGIPARQTVLVQNGRLQTPFLRMKDAKRWGSPPTGIPQGTSGMYLSHSSEKKWDELLGTIEDGVLILSVLGLHTQDSASGRYSLSAPQSLRIMNGKITGRIDVRLTGNFLDDLANPAAVFARSPVNSYPYMQLDTGVQSL